MPKYKYKVVSICRWRKHKAYTPTVKWMPVDVHSAFDTPFLPFTSVQEYELLLKLQTPEDTEN